MEIGFDNFNKQVLGVYFPDQERKEKRLFWKNLLQYAKENKDNRCIIIGDFNSCLQEDSMSTSYSEKELKELHQLGWTDSWAQYNNNDSERYTWYFKGTGNGFRLDYLFISPKLNQYSQVINITHDPTVRKEGLTDHSALKAEINIK